MSSERFRSVKCNENIFVGKCHNQHTTHTAAPSGRLGEKAEGLVRCIALQHQSFLLHMALNDYFFKVIKCGMCTLKLFLGSYCKKVNCGAISLILETN